MPWYWQTGTRRSMTPSCRRSRSMARQFGCAKDFRPCRLLVMTEAALLTACLRAERISLLTLGTSMLPLYQDRVAQVGVCSRVVAYAAPEAPMAFGADASGAVPAVLDELVAACAQMRRAGADYRPGRGRAVRLCRGSAVALRSAGTRWRGLRSAAICACFLTKPRTPDGLRRPPACAGDRLQKRRESVLCRP